MPFQKTLVLTEERLTALGIELLRRGMSESEVQHRVAEVADGITDSFIEEVLHELDGKEVLTPELIHEIADSIGDLVALAIRGIRPDPAKRAMRKAKRAARPKRGFWRRKK